MDTSTIAKEFEKIKLEEPMTETEKSEFALCEDQIKNKPSPLRYFKRNKIHAILNLIRKPSSSLTSADSYSASASASNSTKLGETFIDWSLLTKFECYSKIFEYENKYARLFWTLVFFSFSGVTVWLVVRCIVDFLAFEVTSKTEIVNERPLLFPTLTICNINPFTSLDAQKFINLMRNEYVSTKGIDPNNSNTSLSTANEFYLNLTCIIRSTRSR